MRLSALLLSLAVGGAASTAVSAQPRRTETSVAKGRTLAAKVGSGRGCIAAAHAIRDWGWGESYESSSSSVASIVAAVDYELRLNSGRLPSKDIERLQMAASSADACVRELSIGILETQSEGKVARGRSARLVKSVTPLSEKQSSTGEDSTP